MRHMAGRQTVVRLRRTRRADRSAGKRGNEVNRRRGTTLARVIFLGRWLLGGQN
jgi:hypothetical protein